VDNAIVTTEAEITKSCVIDGSRLEIQTNSRDGKLCGDIRICLYYDDKESAHEFINIPPEFAEFITRSLPYVDTRVSINP
jgi:hypothetical protein